MTASGYGADDKVSKAGDTSTGTQIFDGSPPVQIPAGAGAGKVLTSDSSGNGTWASPPAPSGSASGDLSGSYPGPVVDAVHFTTAPKTSTYAVLTTDTVILCNATSAAFTVTLPTAAGATGKLYVIKKTDTSANAVTVATTSSQTIDGVTTKTLTYQYKAYAVISDGANWQVAESLHVIDSVNTDITTSAVTDTSSAGTTAKVADAGHTHGREGFGTPGSSAVGDSAAAGTATTVAHSDHKHGREAFGSVTAQTTAGASSGNGSAATVSHSDHTHGTPALNSVAGNIAPLGAQAAGTVGTAADAGHVHPTTSVIDGVTVSGTPTANQCITATSGTAANWQTPAAGVTLDTTAGDLKPDNTTAGAGSIGKAADSGHQHPFNSFSATLSTTSAITSTAETMLGYFSIPASAVSGSIYRFCIILGAIELDGTTTSKLYIRNGSTTSGALLTANAIPTVNAAAPATAQTSTHGALLEGHVHFTAASTANVFVGGNIGFGSAPDELISYGQAQSVAASSVIGVSITMASGSSTYTVTPLDIFVYQVA